MTLSRIIRTVLPSALLLAASTAGASTTVLSNLDQANNGTTTGPYVGEAL